MRGRGGRRKPPGRWVEPGPTTPASEGLADGWRDLRGRCEADAAGLAVGGFEGLAPGVEVGGRVGATVGFGVGLGGGFGVGLGVGFGASTVAVRGRTFVSCAFF